MTSETSDRHLAPTVDSSAVRESNLAVARVQAALDEIRAG
jgi:hypothetical protein